MHIEFELSQDIDERARELIGETRSVLSHFSSYDVDGDGFIDQSESRPLPNSNESLPLNLLEIMNLDPGALGQLVDDGPETENRGASRSDLERLLNVLQSIQRLNRQRSSSYPEQAL